METLLARKVNTYYIVFHAVLKIFYIFNHIEFYKSQFKCILSILQYLRVNVLKCIYNIMVFRKKFEVLKLIEHF